MIKRDIIQPSGKPYLTIWLDEETRSIRIKFASDGYTIRLDRKVAPDMYEFFKEIQFYEFCEGKK
jgi:hypothetical protein